eukprot:1555275-Pleurochrysis_carterae.AAC.1
MGANTVYLRTNTAQNRNATHRIYLCGLLAELALLGLNYRHSSANQILHALLFAYAGKASTSNDKAVAATSKKLCAGPRHPCNTGTHVLLQAACLERCHAARCTFINRINAQSKQHWSAAHSEAKPLKGGRSATYCIDCTKQLTSLSKCAGKAQGRGARRASGKFCHLRGGHMSTGECGCGVLSNLFPSSKQPQR